MRFSPSRSSCSRRGESVPAGDGVSWKAGTCHSTGLSRRWEQPPGSSPEHPQRPQPLGLPVAGSRPGARRAAKPIRGLSSRGGRQGGGREAQAVGAEARGEGPGLVWASVRQAVAVLGFQVMPGCSCAWRQLPGASFVFFILLPAFPFSPPLLSLAPARLCHLTEAGEQSHLLWEHRAAAGTSGPAPRRAGLDAEKGTVPGEGRPVPSPASQR